jgi:hypothetical protein
LAERNLDRLRGVYRALKQVVEAKASRSRLLD